MVTDDLSVAIEFMEGEVVPLDEYMVDGGG
jgi:hypothetical protein